jgi:hypothetical protein
MPLLTHLAWRAYGRALGERLEKAAMIAESRMNAERASGADQRRRAVNERSATVLDVDQPGSFQGPRVSEDHNQRGEPRQNAGLRW